MASKYNGRDMLRCVLLIAILFCVAFNDFLSLAQAGEGDIFYLVNQDVPGDHAQHDVHEINARLALVDITNNPVLPQPRYTSNASASSLSSTSFGSQTARESGSGTSAPLSLNILIPHVSSPASSGSGSSRQGQGIKRSRAFSNSQELQNLQSCPTPEEASLVATNIQEDNPWGHFHDLDDRSLDDHPKTKKRNINRGAR